jgi:cell division protein FtsW (lipid II flippase)
MGGKQTLPHVFLKAKIPMMDILASGSKLRLTLIVVTAAGALACALAPEKGAAAVVMLIIAAALFVAEIGLGVADHLRSSQHSDGD